MKLDKYTMEVAYCECNALQPKIYTGKEIIRGVEIIESENRFRSKGISYMKADIIIADTTTGSSHKMRYDVGADHDVIKHLKEYLFTNRKEISEGMKDFILGFIEAIEMFGIKFLYEFKLDGKIVQSYTSKEAVPDKELQTTKNILSGIVKGYGEPITTPDRVDSIEVVINNVNQED